MASFFLVLCGCMGLLSYIVFGEQIIVWMIRPPRQGSNSNVAKEKALKQSTKKVLSVHSDVISRLKN